MWSGPSGMPKEEEEEEEEEEEKGVNQAWHSGWRAPFAPMGTRRV